MLTVRLSRRYLRGVVSVCLTAGVLLWGCAPEQARNRRSHLSTSASVGTLGRVCGPLAAGGYCGSRGWGECGCPGARE